ncbi:MAG: energy transducer TonB [Verrucomicrobiota bacterium]|nr:energy transducer TonB [Verrucomicrobiota bacterium]
MKLRPSLRTLLFATTISLGSASGSLLFAAEIFTPEEIAASVSPKDVSAPKPVKQGNLPRRGENATESGTIKVAFLLDVDGKVKDPRIATSTNEKLNEFAIRTVSKWEFEPIEKDGVKVMVRIIVPLLFKAED